MCRASVISASKIFWSDKEDRHITMTIVNCQAGEGESVTEAYKLTVYINLIIWVGKDSLDKSLLMHQAKSWKITCCYSVAQSCPTLWKPMDCSTPGLPVLHCLPEFAQTHVHWVGAAIQPSHPLSSLCPAFNLSQHQGPMSWWALASASVPPMNIQGWFPLGLTALISLQSKGLSTVFPNTTVWKYQLFSIQLSLWSNSHIHIWLLEKP